MRLKLRLKRTIQMLEQIIVASKEWLVLKKYRLLHWRLAEVLVQSQLLLVITFIDSFRSN